MSLLQKPKREKIRMLTRSSFFLLFIFAPFLDIFRLDLTLGHFIIFGQPWTLGLDAFQQGQGDAGSAAMTLLTHAFLPVLSFIAIISFIIWRYGRIYCGWLCPHFSIVEIFNDMMLKHLNRVTLWEKASKKSKGVLPWLLVLFSCMTMAFVWAFSLLSYLLPPAELIPDLLNFELGMGATRFLLVATTIFTIDFFFARHLFCKFGCAVGVFQSLIWMANSKAMVVSFDKPRAYECQSCDRECDRACPMRLHTRSIKRAKFTCTQCGQCLNTCDQVQADNPDGRIINWVTNEKAQAVDRNAPAMVVKEITSKQ
ncbi:4Fe-4S binding protein [sulfur-oxidizing endosymbiont of Gigantopelta aegis]|uniref:4Fe-4S binding protein n=1 Tax=sulfur-oxidizing endosymbiont of Gigantopelta aegis TaxID=2794934 RepID=UPI0018DB964A|nr:4Fe-4S binding protein [sulfur-oxidizing endosymbiont of Gigantopelta aegis]